MSERLDCLSSVWRGMKSQPQYQSSKLGPSLMESIDMEPSKFVTAYPDRNLIQLDLNRTAADRSCACGIHRLHATARVRVHMSRLGRKILFTCLQEKVLGSVCSFSQ
jgi:hypothetical protein